MLRVYSVCEYQNMKVIYDAINAMTLSHYHHHSCGDHDHERDHEVNFNVKRFVMIFHIIELLWLLLWSSFGAPTIMEEIGNAFSLVQFILFCFQMWFDSTSFFINHLICYEKFLDVHSIFKATWNHRPTCWTCKEIDILVDILERFVMWNITF